MTREDAVKRQIAKIAAEMLGTRIGLLEGCRKIVALTGSLSDQDLSHPDLLAIVALESDLDDIPLGAVRESWDPAALAEKDQRAAELLAAAKQQILDSCRTLQSEWAGKTESG